MTKRDQVTHLVQEDTRLFGRVDIIVKRRDLPGGKLAHEFSGKDLKACFDVNVQGTWSGCQEAIKAFLRSGGDAGDQRRIAGLRP